MICEWKFRVDEFTFEGVVCCCALDWKSSNHLVNNSLGSWQYQCGIAKPFKFNFKFKKLANANAEGSSPVWKTSFRLGFHIQLTYCPRHFFCIQTIFNQWRNFQILYTTLHDITFHRTFNWVFLWCLFANTTVFDVSY